MPRTLHIRANVPQFRIACITKFAGGWLFGMTERQKIRLKSNKKTNGIGHAKDAGTRTWIIPARWREMSGPPEMCGWGGRIRTSAWWNQNPLPYRLATPHYAFKRADHSRDRARLQRGTCNLGKIVPRKRIKSFQTQGISGFFCTMDRQDETGEARAFNCLSRRTEMQAIDSVMQACHTTVLPRLLHAIIKGEVYSSRSVAQSGSAPRSGRGGRRFKSYR